MEFFEKAHQRLSNKSGLELKKKQLKRMLDGHKKHNINIIKNSENVTLDQESDLSVFSAGDTRIREILDSEITPNESMNSVPSSNNSEIEKYSHIENDLKSKTKFCPNPIDVGAFKISADENHKKKSGLRVVRTKKRGKVFLHEKPHKNATESPDESLSNSPLFVSITPRSVSSNLNDVFDDYPAIGTETFSVKQTPLADLTLNMDMKLFSSTKFKKNKVKCIEAEDFNINKTCKKSYNCDLSSFENNKNDNGVEENNPFYKAYEDLSQDSQLNEANTIISYPYRIFKVRDSCVILLKHPVEVYLHGKAKVLALGGTTEILGYTLTSSCSCEIYAPYNSYALILKTMETSNNYYGLFSKLTSLGLSVDEAEDIVTTLGAHDGILYFQKLPSKKLELVNSVFRNSLFHSNNIEKNVLSCTLYSETPRKCFYENPLWANILDCESDKPARGIVCGGKGVGKSTFLKYFVNRHLTYGPVLVIDLDPGQCEFTVAGNVSATVVKEPIIGPNYTHLQTPDRSEIVTDVVISNVPTQFCIKQLHLTQDSKSNYYKRNQTILHRMLHIGMINVMDNLTRYISAVTKLLAFCRENEAYEELPWIVNTMGMCNAVGLKLLLYIIFSVKPTFLLQIDFDASKKHFEYDLNPENVKMLHSTQFQNEPLLNGFQMDDLDYMFFTYKQHIVSTELKSSVSPKDERYFNYLAYFGRLLDMDKTVISLLGVTPYVAPLKSLFIGSNVNICESSINKVLNGKIIALCEYLPRGVKKVFTLTSEPLVCLGYGLVRGIDPDNGLLYVLTPVTQLQLLQVTCVVYGNWAPDIPNDEQTLAPGTLVPYRAEPLLFQPELMQAPRRRFNPLQLLRLAKSS